MRVYYRRHALQRMFERKIEPEEVERTLLEGRVIEEYPDDTPYPSFLKMTGSPDKILHVVYAVNETGEYIVITVYRPDPRKWEDDFSKRKK